jgi:hypothetical protein
MLALKNLNVPSLSVQDSIIVQGDRETLARETLSNLYKATRRAPHIATAVADTVGARGPNASQKYLKFQLLRAACSNFCVGYPRMALVPPVLRST